MIFDQNPQFASDLDWMLQSGQASRELILEALVEEYDGALYALALSVLDDEAAARSARREAYSAALADMYGYRDHIGVQVWFYRIAVQACRRALRRLQTRRALKALLPLPRRGADFGVSMPETELDATLWLALDALDEISRLASLLRYAHGWELPQIAAVLGVTQDELQTGLQRNLEALAAALGDRDDPERTGDIEESLRQSLGRRWPQCEQPLQESEMRAALKLTARRGASRHGVSLAKELTVIAIVILLVGGAIWGVDVLWPEPEPTPRLATVIVTRLVDALRTPFPSATDPAPHATPTPTPLPKDVFYEVLPGDDLYSVARALRVRADELLELNRLPAGASLSAGQRLLIPGSLKLTPLQRVTPIPYLPEVAPLKEPLTSNDILQRILLAGMLLQTVWLDAQIIDYGPVGYIGPPHVQRAQVWFGAEQFLGLIGGRENMVELALLRQGAQLYLASPAEGQPWFFDWQLHAAGQDEKLDSLMLLMDTLGYEEPLFLQSSFVARERQILAGRQTLVVDEADASGRHTARFWLDDRTGLVLRRIAYGQDVDETPVQEVRVTAIVYNVDLPQELLDPRLPWRGGFAQDYTGAPLSSTYRWLAPQARQRLLAQAPPPGFDPSRSRLTFQYLQEIGFMPGMVMDLLADGYLLNIEVLSDPWTMVCQRSPDGERIAYVSTPGDDALSADAHLHWLSLKEAVRYTPFLSLAVTQFAFAPDSQRLALFGRPALGKDGALIVLDTESGESRTLLTLGDVRSLVWSTDGECLALMARLEVDSFEEHVLLINANTGVIEYNSSIDFEHRQSGEWPVAGWGTAFPVEMGGLEACVEAPHEDSTDD
ncbi:MAG: LysM peptidoglycan-binding domain-containing protein [Anaerolineales bacterium]|nr:LysM peptidoglycan-binding domain-containing protein [Anaerolineales bacterium]